MATKTDVLIIGGGSIGLNTGYYLVKSGREVTIIDQNKVADGSSTGNAGHIVPSHIVPLAAPGMVMQTFKWLLNPAESPFSMRISLDPDYLAFLLRFSLACSEANVKRSIQPLKTLGLLSSTNFEKIIRDENLECDYRQKGLLFLYKTEAAFHGGKHEAEILHQNHMPAEILNQQQVREREPLCREDIIGGVHFTGDSSLNPGVFLNQIAEILRKAGSQLFEGESVSRVETSNGRITKVITNNHEFEPETVVLAGGAWSPLFGKKLRLNIPIQPAKGYSLTLKTSGPVPQGALLLGEKRVAITPLGDKIRITGRLELSALDTHIDQKKVDGIASALRDYIAVDNEGEVLETWAGLRPTTPDGVPIIGKPKSISNLVIAAGHAMLGLSLGPGTGQLAAEIVTGKTPTIDLSGFSVNRF